GPSGQDPGRHPRARCRARLRGAGRVRVARVHPPGHLLGDRPLSEAGVTAPDEAAAFPALAAIFSRRSRRFPLGGSLTGPLAYTSDAKPLPLSEEEEEEEAILGGAA